MAFENWKLNRKVHKQEKKIAKKEELAQTTVRANDSMTNITNRTEKVKEKLNAEEWYSKHLDRANLDTEIHEDVVGALVADLERLPQDAAIVSPRLLNADGSLQLCGRPPYPARYYVLQQWHLHREPIDDTAGKAPLFGEVFRTSNITGAAFLIKTDVFRELGWFDETYFFTPEDIALSTLARRKGYGVYVDRAVSVVHKWRTTASRISPAVRPAAVRGSLLFFSGGSRIKYFLLALPVWLAESAKRAKAAVRLRFADSAANRIAWETFRNITCSIFTRLTPKQLFIKYFHG